MRGLRDAVGIALALGLLGGVLARAQDDAFDARMKDAQRNERSAEGKHYATSFQKDFGAGYAPRLSDCAKQTGETPTEGFDILLKLSAKGAVEEALVRPETTFSTCFTKSTKKMTFPVPPSSGYWVLAGMRFTKQ